jgi:2,4-dienoyl-CoA reductase-like NADH-dependent reductase (Old Yellow Enzyme family)
MKSETFKGSVGVAYGEKLSKPIEFSYSVDQFENYGELESAKAIPSNDDVVGFVNDTRKINERAKAMTKALEAAGYSKPDPNDPIVAANTMIRNLEKMENMPANQKAMMIGVLRQQVADEEARRKAEKESTPATT